MLYPTGKRPEGITTGVSNSKALGYRQVNEMSKAGQKAVSSRESSSHSALIPVMLEYEPRVAILQYFRKS